MARAFLKHILFCDFNLSLLREALRDSKEAFAVMVLQSDPGAATGDASVDLEMFATQSHPGDVAVIGMPHLAPTACSNPMPLADGQLARAAVTCGDGACSLHALWGTLIPCEDRTEYYCVDARTTLCNAMPIDLQELRNSRCGAAVEALLHNLWADAVSYRMRAMQQQDFFPGCHFFIIL